MRKHRFGRWVALWGILVCCTALFAQGGDLSAQAPDRGEVLRWFEESVYGAPPPRPARVSFELRERGLSFGGYAERRQYRIVSENAGRSNVIDVLVFLPRSVTGKVPAFVYPNFYGNEATVCDAAVLPSACDVYGVRRQMRGAKESRANVRGILERGYAAVTFCYGATYPDVTGGMAKDRFTRDVAPQSVWALFPEFKGARMAHGAWSWGSMRVRDLIARIEAIDPARVAICGHSRMGKNAVVTGVYDSRYALVFANDGGMNALENVSRKFVHWFKPRPAEMRFNQQDFVALIAPRALFVSAAHGDRYQSAHEAETTLDAADWAWRRHGKSIGWHAREGQHGMKPEDWRAALDYAENTLGWKVARGPYPLIDAGPERVPESIRPPFELLGTLKPRPADEIRASNWTIGCECIGRGYADFWQYAGLLRPLNIRHARVQACWARCEKTPGAFDFAWLDGIVDFLRAEGIGVMLETSYGNPVHPDAGGWDLGAGFPKGAGLGAWDAWVRALATHFKGRVAAWAMWNEPDIANPVRPGDASHKRPAEIAAFNVRTAKVIREVIPAARIAGLSLARTDAGFFEDCLKAMGADVRLFDSFVYHGYRYAPEESYADVERLKAVLKRYHPTARMYQGENGCPSDYTRKFALDAVPWSEVSQAKWDIRRMLGDLGHDVRSSVFTICDFNHAGREINRKGLLRANAKGEVIGIKRAYYAVQNVASVFDDRLKRIDGVTWTNANPEVTYNLYRDAKGRDLLVYWRAREIDYVAATDRRINRFLRPGDSFEIRPTVFTARDSVVEDPVVLDLYSGRVWALPRKAVVRSSTGTAYIGLPLYDSPCVVCSRDFVFVE